MAKNINLDALRALRADPKNSYGYNARRLNLAYGLIRGLPMERLESPSSNPHLFPDHRSIADLAMTYYRPIAEGQMVEDYEAEKKAFRAKMEADLLAWKKRIYLAWIEAEPKKQARNIAKRAQPRTHRPMPASLARSA